MTKIEVILFSADWCKSCKTLKTQIDKIGLKKPFREERVDKNSSLAPFFKVQSLPTLIIYDIEREKELGRFVGYHKKKMEEFLKKWGII